MTFNMLYLYFSADIPLAQVKLGEIGAWLARRNKSPQAAIGAVSRAFWRWNHKYCQSKRVGVAPFFHVVVTSSIVFYCFNYDRISEYFFKVFVVFSTTPQTSE